MGFSEWFEIATKLVQLDLDHQTDEARASRASLEQTAATAQHLRMAMLRDQQNYIRLRELAVEQEHEIEDLRFALQTLFELARRSGAIDMNDYCDRVVSEVAARARERPASPPLVADRDHVECQGCGGIVPKTKTTITLRGTMCDQCAFWST